MAHSLTQVTIRQAPFKVNNLSLIECRQA
jgi:hypothetical protein